MAAGHILLLSYHYLTLLIPMYQMDVATRTRSYLTIILSLSYLTYANVSNGCGNKDKFHYSSTTIECIVNGTYCNMENYYSKQSLLLLY